MIERSREANRRIAVYLVLRLPAYVGEGMGWLAERLCRRHANAMRAGRHPDFLALSLSFPAWILIEAGEALKRPARRALEALMELDD